MVIVSLGIGHRASGKLGIVFSHISTSCSIKSGGIFQGFLNLTPTITQSHSFRSHLPSTNLSTNILRAFLLQAYTGQDVKVKKERVVMNRRIKTPS